MAWVSSELLGIKCYRDTSGCLGMKSEGVTAPPEMMSFMPSVMDMSSSVT